MSDHDLLAERFEKDRPRLRALAYRMLGSGAEAEDAVQEAWIRLSRSRTDEVENLSGWLTTIVARVSLNMLQSRKSRPEDLVDTTETAEPHGEGAPADPEEEAVLADSVGVALLVVLDTLTPAERLAFVLHDMFAVPFDQIATIVDRSPAAARQLASRARRRVQQRAPLARSRAIGVYSENGLVLKKGRSDLANAFLAASRQGNFEALLAMLDPDIVLRSDATAAHLGMDAELRGADAVTRLFAGHAWAPLPAVVDGAAGLVWVKDEVPFLSFRFTVGDGLITEIAVQAELSDVDIVLAL
ncbi:sigma-70 family RNA polymerase sigma factor [Streptomyces sp. WMMC500]|uniref:sigma-70 family RNA polymerase sigma factor n=1 Tax=Streptomyces sp. WMMC500 TaxID=3015154 RepID=UPI00248B5571|nr:sigma-70 family RNA polymerase sigma factor [Streptomyces sp. WMMC500]WBB63115.1 sigma-70 family RNA polymerase sigma factor [Streptomyces sp. WMMC500]